MSINPKPNSNNDILTELDNLNVKKEKEKDALIKKEDDEDVGAPTNPEIIKIKKDVDLIKRFFWFIVVLLPFMCAFNVILIVVALLAAFKK